MSKDNENSSVRCVRAPRDSQHPYFMTARAVAQDTSLNLDERGLLWYILSLPDDWIAHPTQLGKANGVKSKDKTYKLFKSLMKSGYCERINKRENGRHHSTIYMFYEDKQQRLIDLYKDTPKSDPSFLKNRKQEIPDPENLTPVKQDITDNIYPTEEKKKKRRNASLPSIEFDYESNEFIHITDADRADWTKLYQGVDIDFELQKMRQWLIDPKNPARDGNRTFINNWLSKATPKKPQKKPSESKPIENSRADGSNIPYNDSMGWIKMRKSKEDYIAYLKSVNEQKYYNNFLKGIYEKNYLAYLEELANPEEPEDLKGDD